MSAEGDALPNLASLMGSTLEADLEAARRETTKDYSSLPLWKLLATTTPDPYGLRSKPALRLLEKQLKKRSLHRRPKGCNLDGSKRKKRADEIRAATNKYWREVRSESRKERLRVDPEYKFHTLRRMQLNWGLEWTLPYEVFLEHFWNKVVKDEKKDPDGRKRRKPLHLINAKWQLKRIDTTKGWEEGNIKIHIVKPKRRKKGKRLLRSKSKVPYGKQKGLGYIKPPKKEKPDGHSDGQS